MAVVAFSLLLLWKSQSLPKLIVTDKGRDVPTDTSLKTSPLLLNTLKFGGITLISNVQIPRTLRQLTFVYTKNVSDLGLKGRSSDSVLHFYRVRGLT